MKENIGESLHKLMHHYRHQLREAALKSGISIPVSHIRSLKCINKIEKCSAKDIADRLSLDKSQITRVLKELVQSGYVEKIRSPDNHRSQLLSLTMDGAELLTKITMLERTATENMTQNLTEQQIEDFTRISEIMVSNLDQSPPCDNQS
ncbi:MAG: MarR family winged helix-turn-helix transcriptional regulator [Gammaproteobacteria bacterium]|jgi:DNA-binding MarR family transcriptional regulator|uniref:MarR family winged helix-turn-helix transcriptional regulator n=1 Tax=Marinomonas TaxID=28253 RepID=UPI000C1EB0E3|nr:MULTISPECIES: MarR family winged helix-turn-helix transcriptional regulator [unclassified Marinomonas]MBU1296660.1 MarR family winged helix-turn-helix transcriptional regulator [Gammaproteobacteria bacterium]MBU1466134.1 MarR family winged helix-turn-helix transcriptional regulator [Gammaproteobacteria bacterium]MBU2024731.1 MarR family winged helix-turn-helix transcriptional regulator [Gammaproteobacteria bacterium]MBU2238982.1 MarR family winged helix-turn-helix transcriptional regulator [